MTKQFEEAAGFLAGVLDGKCSITHRQYTNTNIIFTVTPLTQAQAQQVSSILDAIEVDYRIPDPSTITINIKDACSFANLIKSKM